MSGTAEEVGHHKVGGEAFGEGGIIGTANGVTVGPEPRAAAGMKPCKGTAIGQWDQLFDWVNHWPPT